MALSKQILGNSITQRSLNHLSSSSSYATPFPLSSVSMRSIIQTNSIRRSHFQLEIRSQSSNSSRRPTPMSRSAVSSPAAETGELVRETLNTADQIDGRSFGSRVKVRAVVTVRNKNKEDLKETIFRHVDALTDKIGKNVVLQLVSTDLDPRTRGPKKSAVAALKDWSKKSSTKAERVNYTAEFLVDSNFGMPGAILVTNKHQQEFFLEAITIEGFACGPVHFPCNSWVQSKKDIPGDQGQRIFFHNQPYLPHETPAGLKALREKELKDVRGDGTGQRKSSDRIYDYDVYNDLGNPDDGYDLARPVLGGKKIPYPRRCRTGRPPSETDMNVESRVEKPFSVYVPRDEQFEESKAGTFSFCRLKAVLHNLWPSLTTNISAKHDFSGFLHLDSLFNEGLLLKLGLQDEELLSKLPKIVSKIQATSQELLKFDTPMIVSKDKHAWMRDDEFARQFVAGVNPMSIERLQTFPPVSKLDPETYGPPESAIKEEHIISQLDGLSVNEAMDAKRLFIADYHDTFIPFLDRINALDGRKSYATRALFFRTSLGTLKPIAIELSLPTTGSCSCSKRVITPPVDATSYWIWQLAKAHVCSNDAGVHQLVHHWLRTHASLEPFILAAHRRLSVMHPIFKLLDPHMRYTLEINALARQRLVNADGVIESCFTPGRYSMELSAAAYKDWRFDLEGLPSDLVRRGMAELDPSQPHGIKLVLEDYPYANDGLLIWEAIENWVRTYVTRYYPDSSDILHDQELQGWYYEAINVGHGDLRDASWWPKLDNQDGLVQILTILIWLASAQHAALNFGQYPYGGYIPNRPVLMRRLIPEESSPEYKSFLEDPQRYYMSSIPSVVQTSKFIAVIDTLSTHSPDEEYLGERAQASTWTGDSEMIEEFFEFSAEMGKIEKEIEKRNGDCKLRNRCGAGVMAYELMAPTSEPGVTGRGVPNSVTI